MCTEQLPPGGYPIAVKKYIISKKAVKYIISKQTGVIKDIGFFNFLDASLPKQQQPVNANAKHLRV
jgi:hypothetical protein